MGDYGKERQASFMSTLLKPSQTVKSEGSGLPCIVKEFIGGGGQGEVYRAEWGGKEVALKWYFPKIATPTQKAALANLVKTGSPDNRFLWPLELTSSATTRGFGYIMPLRPKEYKSIVDLMKRRVEPDFRTLVTAAIELSDCFLQLHSRGYCYRDISFGNVFFHPTNGAILICDNDNVGLDGDRNTTVLGTPRFMAPEVVRGDASPGINTDLYSLAVLIFYLLIVHHPLEGRREAAIRCLDLPAMNKLYGEQPLFIFHPVDRSNAPMPCYHDNALVFWPLYPLYVRHLFTRAFTEGLHAPHRRVRESEWRGALTRLRDAIFYCSCSRENFYCPDTMRNGGWRAGHCWNCENELRLPPRLQVGNHFVMLNFNTQIFPHHINPSKIYDFSVPAGMITQNPENPSIWGLKNLTDESWEVNIQGEARSIPAGRALKLTNNVHVNFGTSTGVINF